MLILGYIGAILVGFTLGLLGGGGSILTVPIFVYILDIDPIQATAYSLFVVGVSASIGALKYMRKGLINYRAAILFAVPSFMAIFMTRKFLMPALPDTILSLGDVDITTDVLFLSVLIFALVLTAFILLKTNLNQAKTGNFVKVIWLLLPAAAMVFIMRQFVIPTLPENIFYLGDIVVTKGLAIMLIFALVMIFAGTSMIRPKPKSKPMREGEENTPLAKIIIYGALIGVVTGIVGAGGGFLLVPALVLFARLPIKLAIGTSLLIISANSLIGFLGDVSYQHIEWTFLLSFTSISVLGILGGIYTSQFVSADRLKRIFGLFILCMAGVIVIKELIIN